MRTWSRTILLLPWLLEKSLFCWNNSIAYGINRTWRFCPLHERRCSYSHHSRKDQVNNIFLLTIPVHCINKFDLFTDMKAVFTTMPESVQRYVISTAPKAFAAWLAALFPPYSETLRFLDYISCFTRNRNRWFLKVGSKNLALTLT